MPDNFENRRSDMDDPAEKAFAISPSDTDNLPFTTRGIYTGAGGQITVDMVDEGKVTFTNLPPGTILPIRVRKVYATGTTASMNLVGLV